MNRPEPRTISCPLCGSDSWYTDMSDDEVKVFEKKLGHLLYEFGFPYDEKD